MATREQIEKRFWRKVDKTGPCWLWIASIFKQTLYGQFWDGQKNRTAHSFALELKLGRPLNVGMIALHNCPEKKRHCVLHVYEGSYAQNEADKIPDATTNIGEGNGQSKLTENEVREIREHFKTNYRGKAIDIAEQYGINKTTVWQIWRRQRWAHLE